MHQKNTSNSLPAIYLKTSGLIVEDLQAYLAILLFMGILHLPRLDNYWSSEQIYRNFIPKVMSKNFFKMISAVLHLPISGGGNFVDDEEENENERENDDGFSKMMDDVSSKMTLTEDESKVVNYEDGKQHEKLNKANNNGNDEQSQIGEEKKKRKSRKDLNFEVLE